MNQPDPVLSDTLDHPDIYHGFHTRIGGVSTGLYSGLNVGLGSDDDRSNVLENRQRVSRHAGVEPDNLMTVYQIDSPDIVTITEAVPQDKRAEADGLVTALPGFALGVLTADCGPVLFADLENSVVGACHSGWKGATGGVLENTIEAMEKIGANRTSIRAVLGPTISGKNYEVGPEFVDNLHSLDPKNETFLKPSEQPGHAMFDLPGYIVDRLNNAGVTAAWTGDCTYADEERFFSYRRKTHRNEPDYGRQISVISIKQT